MKKVSKWLSILLAVCLLVSVASVSVSAAQKPNKNWKQPKVDVGFMSKAPSIDGKFTESEWKGATKVEFTQKALTNGAGYVWTYTDDTGLIYDALPDDGNGNAYMGWDGEYFYFALVVDDEQHTSSALASTDLWKDDCVQFSIGSGSTGVRYEYGFAMGSNNRQLGHRWSPTDKELQSSADVKYQIGRSGTTTTYEVAMKPAAFGVTDAWTTGTKFAFAFSLHLYDSKLYASGSNGYFMEWADGVVGGSADKTLLNAAAMTLTGGSDSGSSTPTTTKEPEKTTTTTKKGDPVNPGTPADPTPTVTTTTIPPIVEEGYSTFTEDKATDAAEKVLSKLQEKFENIEISVKEFKADDQKLLVAKSETLKGVFVKDGSKYKEITGTEHAKDANWMEYDLGSKGQTVYVVNEILPTTTVDESATTTVGNVTTTTKGDSAKATTTTAADTATNAEDGGSFPWWIIVVVVVVLAAAGVGVWFFLKKKGDDADDTDGDNE